jgi:hypothetical protein
MVLAKDDAISPPDLIQAAFAEPASLLTLEEPA